MRLPPIWLWFVFFDKNTTSVNISDNEFKKLEAGTVFYRVAVIANWYLGHAIL
jgi:hypothetical protein